MLILRRRIGERIIFAEGAITIEVLSVSGDTVKIGIQALPEISVVREELLLPIQKEDDGQQHTVSPQTFTPPAQ
jgi:carbon storage regulator CsrA